MPPSSPQSPFSANPKQWQLRPAEARDIWPIRRLVLGAGLDPTQLRWQQFWVIERQGNIIACGQLRRFEGAQELGSMVVHPSWRHQGIGRALGRHLIQQADSPLYLECLGQRRVRFYRQLGFQPVDSTQLPAAIGRKFALTQTLARLLRLPLFIMAWQETSSLQS